MPKKILAGLLLIAFSILGGCSFREKAQAFLYRIPTDFELLKFLPKNYFFAPKGAETNALNFIEANLDDDLENEIVLLLVERDLPEGQDEAGPVKLEILDFDTSSNTWKQIASKELEKYNQISFSYQKFDVNRDNMDEILISPFYIGGSDGEQNIFVLALQNQQIVDLMPEEASSSLEGEGVYNNAHIYDADYIWASNETHFACHNFTVQRYIFNGQRFVFDEQKNSRKRYALDEGDAQGACPVFSSFLDLVKNEPELL